jgi:hypothetical protein
MNSRLDSQISHKMPWDNSKPNTTWKDVHFQDKISQPWDSTHHATASQAPRDGAQAPRSDNMSNAHITCFSCGAKGHYASDIKCPNYGNTSISQRDKPQLRAARTDDDDKHSTESSNSNGVRELEGQANNSLDGSQFDDETEREDIYSDSTSTVSTKQEAYQRPMCLNTPFSEIDSDDDYIVYNRATRITNTPIKEHPSCSSLRKKED